MESKSKSIPVSSEKKFKNDEQIVDIPENENEEEECNIEGVIILKCENMLITLEMIWLSGNKEYFHQIYQHFKNYWNTKPKMSE